MTGGGVPLPKFCFSSFQVRPRNLDKFSGDAAVADWSGLARIQASFPLLLQTCS